MIAKWKSQFLEAAPQIFLDKRRKENKKQEVKVDDLYQQMETYRYREFFMKNVQTTSEVIS
ncbi:MAG: hypothetical protein SVM86_04450 [Candidatus Cloacimonadota bacterium]|nr:hypothetical protein [Candidatus Cloacimonadota bacterium]